MIFEFNSKERLDDIKESYQRILEIRSSLSDKRAKYRKVANILKIDYYSLERCFKEFECSLLISCYTFSEQLIKNYFYFLLKKGKYRNTYLNKFLDSKINSNKFSPNVKYERIKKLFNEDLDSKFELMFDLDIELINKYNELVGCRHAYAHNGIYRFNFDNFKDVINVLEFFRSDLFVKINNCDKYEQIKKLFNEIIKDIEKLKDNNLNKRYLSTKIKKLRPRISKLDKLIQKLELDEIVLIRQKMNEIKKINEIDLRTNEKIREILNEVSL